VQLADGRLLVVEYKGALLAGAGVDDTNEKPTSAVSSNFRGALPNASRSAFRPVALWLQAATSRNPKRAAFAAGQDFDDHRIDGYHSSS
jgi:hypothetical protein